MIKKIFLALLFSLFLFRIWQTSGCQQFISNKFLPISVTIRVEEQVGNDENLPRNVSRIFHNKLTEGFFEISKSYTKTFDPKVLLSILGPLGFLSLIFAFLKITQTKNNYYRTHLLLTLSLPLFSLISSNAMVVFFVLASSFFSFAAWGVDFFTKSNVRKAIFILLALFSYFYFSYNWQMPQICNEIFFN